MLTGYKFESIRKLHNADVVAWEMLSTARPHVNLEHFFHSLSADARERLFFAQLQHLLSCPDSGKIYVNLTSGLILTDNFINRLCDVMPVAERIAIEVTDLEAIIRLAPEPSRILRERISELRRLGYEVWADDVDEALVASLMEKSYCFHGVKIDKHAFWSARGHQSRCMALISQCRKLAAHVLIEGIETERDFELARASLADFGQGYLWNKPS